MKQDEKIEFLINTYCENEYEQNEMKKWIHEKGVELVYDTIISLFYTGEMST